MDADSLSVGITGFIDILGFGDRVLSAESVEDIAEIRRLVAKIQREFDFETDDDLIKEVQQIYRKTILAFSDCVVVNIPLQSDATKYDGTFDPIMSELTGFAYAQGGCVQSGLFLRGGVDLGWWHHSRSTLISGSMVGACKAENRANVPVIALTDELYKYFSDHKHRRFYSKDADPVKKILRRYESGDGTNKVEFWYLDYITICAESLDWKRSKAQLEEYRAASPDQKDEIMAKGYRENLDIWFSQHARQIESAHAKAGTDKVRDKYLWLSSYHNEIAEGFTRNPECKCSVE